MRKIRNSKKFYIKPELEVVAVDHEISLVMASSGVPPWPGSASEISPVNSAPAQTYTPSSENNPFGGSSPDYSN